MIVSEALEKAGETVSRDREADRVVGMVGLAVLLVIGRWRCCDRDDEDEFIRFFLLLLLGSKSSGRAARSVLVRAKV